MQTTTPATDARTFPADTPCTCPGDCNCRMPAWMFRFVSCGCRQHQEPETTSARRIENEAIAARRAAPAAQCCDRNHSPEGPHYFNGIGIR